MSHKITLKINHKDVTTESGQSILQVCNKIGIHIPTLCYEPELNAYGSCWVCSVKLEGLNGFVTSCGTEAREGMSVITDSQEVHTARRTALELLLSNHYADCEAPCKIACPAYVDIQTYVSFTANGQRKEALKTVMKNLPLPMSVGRICPAFCEVECRRKLVDEAVAIRQIKRYDADIHLESDWCYVPEKEADKGKRVAIVGAGPGGLSCGYFLSAKGYDVTIYEAAAQAGGWLRYGIPEYRLPKDILAREVEILCKNGMKILTDTCLGRDIFLKEIAADHDAVFLAIGAQLAVPLRFNTKDLKGIYLGVDYLRQVAEKRSFDLGKKVAIVGGGNTAIDCARTARRSGAEVTVLYRRTQHEMPAEHLEISHAMEEGVKFEFLVNPVDVIGKNGNLDQVSIDIMELGDEDSSGRRRPVSTGKTKTVRYDSLIAAVSQKVDISWADNAKNQLDAPMPFTKWNTFKIDPETMHWTANCFAGGDGQRGPATAIEAIADAKVAAGSIDRFLQGKIMSVKARFNSRKAEHIDDLDPAEFKKYIKIQRIASEILDPVLRSTSIEEVEKTFTDEQAQQEASRCLECGCMVNSDCKLREYATEYEADQEHFSGEITHHPIDDSHPFIQRDPNKCIMCGRCIRTCAEVQGPAVLGYIYRGFNSVVGPDFGLPLQETSCVNCGKCIDVCPTGALLPKTKNYKQNPRGFHDVPGRCSECGLACEITLRVSEDRLIRVDAAPDNTYNERELCYKGRFAWQNEQDSHDADTLQGALALCDKSKNTKICVTGSISLEMLNDVLIFSKDNDLEVRSLGLIEDPSDTRLDLCAHMKDIDSARRIILIGEIKQVLKSKARLTQLRQGSELVIVNGEEGDRFNDYADRILKSSDELQDLLEENIKTVLIYERENISKNDRQAVWDFLESSPDATVWVNSRQINTRGLISMGLLPLNVEKTDQIILLGRSDTQLEIDTIRVKIPSAHHLKGQFIIDTGKTISL